MAGEIDCSRWENGGQPQLQAGGAAAGSSL